MPSNASNCRVTGPSLVAAAGAVMVAAQEVDAAVQHFLPNLRVNPVGIAETNLVTALFPGGTDVAFTLKGIQDSVQTINTFMTPYGLTSFLTTGVRNASFTLSGNIANQALIPPGQTVDSGDTFGTKLILQFASTITSMGAPIATAATGPAGLGTHYFGFRLTTAGSGNTFFGWGKIRVDTISGSGIDATLLEWAYEDTPGLGIVVGSVSSIPEPSTVAAGLGLLALGAAGVRCARKRKGISPPLDS